MPGKSKKKKFNAGLWRDHSANQRTYLSWMRSAIALMGFGWVIIRLQTPPRETFNIGRLTGFSLSVAGILTVIIATRYYFLVREAIDNDTYEPSTLRVICFSVAVMVFGAAILYFLLTDADIQTLDPIYLS